MKIVDALERLRAPLNPMVALARRIGWGLAIVVGLLIATTILTARTGDFGTVAARRRQPDG